MPVSCSHRLESMSIDAFRTHFWPSGIIYSRSLTLLGTVKWKLNDEKS